MASCPACDRTAVFAFEKDGFVLVRCPSCHLLFRRDLPSAEELLQIYGEAYFKGAETDTGGQGYDDYVRDAPYHRRNARSRLELLERFVEPGRLLDVGSAAGFFLAEAAGRGWTAEGIELADSMAAYGRGTLGVRVESGDFATANVEPASLDAVTMWDYLEHSVDPRGDLLKAARVLRTGGVLAISTGDLSSLVGRVSGKRWHLLTPRHHNFFFTRQSLFRLFGRTGLHVLSARHRGSLYPVRYLLYKLRTMADVEPVRRFAQAASRSRAGSWTVPLNLYDVITIVARKER